MTSTARNIEETVLDNAAAQLRAEGYDVYVRPSKQSLPEFLRGWEVDAIAFGPHKNIAIEVVTDSQRSRQKADSLRELFADRTDWEIRFQYVLSATPTILPIMPPETFGPTIERIEWLVREGLNSPALLLGWATIEALARARLPVEFGRPQTPGRVIEILASRGFLTPTEADHLREMRDLRNMLIHGDLQVKVSNADMQKLIRTIKVLKDLP